MNASSSSPTTSTKPSSTSMESRLVNDRFYRVSDVAVMLCMSRSHAYRLVKQGTIPSLRISQRRIVIPESLLTKWMAQNIYGDIFHEQNANS